MPPQYLVTLTIIVAPKKSGSRSNRQTDVDNDLIESPPPPVGDTSSWPTPQLAQGEEKRKTLGKNEKMDRTDKDKASSVRPHGKEKWTPVPYVPTAVFNTPLPPAARRGGRPARGGREGNRGGGHTALPSTGGDRATSGSTTQAAGPKQTLPVDRGRNDVRDTRATSDNVLPVKTGRSNSADAAAPSAQQKPSQLSQLDRARGDTMTPKDLEDSKIASLDAHQHSHSNTVDALPRHRRDSKTFGKSHEFSSLPHQKPVEYQSRHVSLHGDSHGPTRYNANHERRFDSGPRPADFYREPGTVLPRDRELTRERGEREFGRDREYHRDRSDFHKDREYGRDRGDSRPERGRGGYRGRGVHSSYGGVQNPQFHNAVTGQHPFPPPKSFSVNERHRLPQQGSQNGSQQHHPNHRLIIRSPSLPNAAMYGPTPYPIQTDINAMYGYQQLPPGPMTALPYQPYLEHYTLMSMISMQL